MWKKTVSGDASPLSKEEDEADEAEADEGDEAVSSVLRGRGFSLGMGISGWLGKHKGDFMWIQCGLNENLMGIGEWHSCNKLQLPWCIVGFDGLIFSYNDII